MAVFTFPAAYARRMPDPVFGSDGVTRHIFMVRVRDVPKGLPLDPNARVPNINRRVYQDVARSLRNENGTAGTFHLKHKGITIVADDVRPNGKDMYDVQIGEGLGILDGGHTIELITSTPTEDLPTEQYVKFEIITNIPGDWIAELAGGLNTSVQVQAMSLDNLAGQFEWIKDELGGEPYVKNIAWRENEPGDFDARDLVSIMTLFNIFSFPNEKDDQPVTAYEKKSLALQLFEHKPKEYQALRPILKDILILHDTIRRDSRALYNAAGGRFAALNIVEEKKRGEFEFPFTGKRAKHRLPNGALYPMLGAFRWMVDMNGAGEAEWRGGFARVVRLWEESGAELMRMTAQASEELGRNPNAIGKSRNHWANLHARVAKRDLMANAAISASESATA